MRTVVKHLLLCALLAATLALTACNGDSGEGGGDDTPTKPFVTIGTASKGGTFMAIGANMAELLNGHTDELGWRKVNAKPLAGSMANMKALSDTDRPIQFGMANASITWFAYRGEATIGGKAEAKQDVRNVMTLFAAFGQFVSKNGSDIKTIAGLKGKRIITGPAGAGFENFLRPVLDAHGVAWSDIEAVPLAQGQVLDAIQDGTVDAAFLGGAVPHATVAQAMSSSDVQLLAFDEAALDALVAKYSFFTKRTIKAETYQSQAADFVGLNVGVAHIVAAPDADADMVYGFVKTIYENREALVPKHPAFRSINPKNVARDLGFPYHEGAIKAYKELGVWPEQTTE